MKDVYEEKLDSVVQPENSPGCHIDADTEQGQHGKVSRTEPPHEQIDEVFLKGDQIPPIVANPGHFSSCNTSTQVTSHLFSKVLIIYRPISYLEKEVDVS